MTGDVPVYGPDRRDPADTFVWVDLETTGLSARRQVILEVGFRITDAQLKLIAQHHWVLTCTRTVAERTLLADKVVLEMHDKSGLWDECRTSPHTARSVDPEAAEWLYDQGINAADGHPLCGSSVGFDRGFLEEHMVTTWAMFGYRNVDVSSIKELAKRSPCPPDVEQMPVPRKLHRVLPDIDDTIEELRFYRAHGYAP